MTCQTEPHLTEVVRRTDGDEQMPLFMGRHSSDERGGVLVETWGTDSEATIEFIHELLDDPLLGIETSSDLNAQGEALSNFEVLETQTTTTSD